MFEIAQEAAAKFSLVSLCPPIEHVWALAGDDADTMPSASIASAGQNRFMDSSSETAGETMG
ncbi:MAG: hypothetical protein ABI960_00005, partial [Candidatus Eisenbacteria bacterium]